MVVYMDADADHTKDTLYLHNLLHSLQVHYWDIRRLSSKYVACITEATVKIN